MINEIAYQGSKKRFLKILKPLIENNLEEGMVYIEPFGGGMNSFTPIISTQKIANDVNEYNIALWQELKEKGFDGVEKEWSEYLNTLSNCEDKPNGLNYLQAKLLYLDMKQDCLTNGGKYPKALLGFVAYACSFGGGWWNGFSGFNEKKGENYVKEAINGLKKQLQTANNIEDSTFVNGEYNAINIPDNAFIYCDPPYSGTKKYSTDFDSESFWNWCRNIIETRENIKILISEYNAPSDFICIWSDRVQDKMGNNTMSKNEKLFIHNSQVSDFDLSSLSETISISRNDIMEMVKKSVNKILNENDLDELEAFHGSSVLFDKFDMSFVGSGEGSQVYGWGVYLTDVKDTGRWYAATIALKNAGRDNNNPIKLIYGLIKGATGRLMREMNPKNFLKKRDVILNRLQEKLNISKGDNTKQRVLIAINYVEKCNSLAEFSKMLINMVHQSATPYKRYVYQVDIPDNGYINWNNTNKQFINKIFSLISQKFNTSHVDINTVTSFGDMYEKLRGWVNKSEAKNGEIIPQKDLSLFLSSLGFKGITVPTGNKSGGDGRGTNYVIFKDSDVKIIKQINMQGKENFYK